MVYAVTKNNYAEDSIITLRKNKEYTPIEGTKTPSQIVQRSRDRVINAYRSMTVDNGNPTLLHFADTPEEILQVQEDAIPDLRNQMGWGWKKIHNFYRQQFGDHVMGTRTIQTRLTNLKKYGFTRPPKDKTQPKITETLFGRFQRGGLPAECSRYVAKLSFMKSVMLFGETLNPIEQHYASLLMNIFNDPDGKNIDLYAQYSLIHEYAERDKNQQSTEDLDTLVMYAPWEDEGMRYDLALHSEESEVDTPPYPFIRLLMPMYPEGTYTIMPFFRGAIAHLGLPFSLGFSRQEPGRNQTVEFEGFTNKTNGGAIWLPLRVQDKEGNWIDTTKDDLWKRKSWCDSDLMIMLLLKPQGKGKTRVSIPGIKINVMNEIIKEGKDA